MLPRYSAQLGTVAVEDQSHIHSCRLWAGRSVFFLTDLPGDGQGVSTLMCSGDPSCCCGQMQRAGRGTGLFSQKLVVVTSLFSQIFHSASWWEIQSYLVVLEVRREHLQHVLPMSSCEAPWCLQGHHQPVALSPPFLLKMAHTWTLGPT